MATAYTLAFLRVGAVLSPHDYYLWGERELDSILKDAIKSSSEDYQSGRYAVIAKHRRPEGLTPNQSANILLEHLNQRFQIDEIFSLSRYVVPAAYLHVIMQSNNAPHAMGSRTELKNFNQGTIGKEMWVALSTSTIEAPVHPLPAIGQHCVILGGGNITEVRLLVGEIELVSSDNTALPLKANANVVPLIITIAINFRRNGEILESGSTFSNNLVYFDAPNTAIIEQIAIKNTLNSSADFNITRNANILMDSFIKQDGRRAEYERTFQGSRLSETIIYDEPSHVGAPDLAMASSFKFTGNAQHDQNTLHGIDEAMDTNFGVHNYDTQATATYPTKRTVFREIGATAPKQKHPSYTFGVPVNVRSTFVPNATIARYSFSLEHQFIEIYFAPTKDVITYIPSDVVLSVHTSMFILEADASYCHPIVHMIVDFPFIKDEPLPNLTIDNMAIISVRLNLIEQLNDAITQKRTLCEDIIIFKEEQKTDQPKSSKTTLDLTRLPAAICQAGFLIPRIDPPPGVRHLLWHRAGAFVATPYYKKTNKILFIGGPTSPFQADKLKLSVMAANQSNNMPKLLLNKATWLLKQDHFEFLMNPLRRMVHEIHYKFAGYEIHSIRIANMGSISLQNLVHYNQGAPQELIHMARHFNEHGPRGSSVEHMLVVDYAHKSSDLYNKSPRGPNFGKISQARFDIEYTPEFLKHIEKKRSTTNVLWVIIHAIANIQQSESNMSYSTFSTQ